MLPANSFLRFPASDLSRFVADTMTPSTEYNTLLGQGMDAVAAFLRNAANFSVSKVVKGGSAGKGTTVRNMSDIDIAVFLNDFNSTRELQVNMESTLEAIRTQLVKYANLYNPPHQVTVTKVTRFFVTFDLKASGMSETVEIDLLPAYDNIRLKGLDATYLAMSRGSEVDRQYFSSSLAELQIDFVKKRPALVKDLIRLVKYWRKTHFEQRMSAMSLPSSYVMELVVIWCWERAGQPDNFNLAKGLKVVIETLAENTGIECQWREYYNPDIPPYQVVIHDLMMEARTKQIPFILDPANPFNNTAARFRTWTEVAHVARASLDSPCLRNVVQTWNWK